MSTRHAIAQLAKPQADGRPSQPGFSFWGSGQQSGQAGALPALRQLAGSSADVATTPRTAQPLGPAQQQQPSLQPPTQQQQQRGSPPAGA